MTLTPEKSGETLTQEEAIASLGNYGYGWSDSDVAGASAQRGLSEAVVRDISAKKNEPDWMLKTRLKAPAHLRQEADAVVGFQPRGHRLRQHQVLRALDGEAGRQLGRAARGHQEHLRQARDPGG